MLFLFPLRAGFLIPILPIMIDFFTHYVNLKPEMG